MAIQEFETEEEMDDAFERIMEKMQDEADEGEEVRRISGITPTATLTCSLDVECPKCEKEVDLLYEDEDNGVSRAIFNNNWGDLNGYEVKCPECGHEFTLDGVEY